MSRKKLIYIGAAIFVGSVLIGLLGTFFGIAGSYAALDTAESSGIAAIGDGIYGALVSSIIALVGSLIGVGVIIFALIRSSPPE